MARKKNKEDCIAMQCKVSKLRQEEENNYFHFYFIKKKKFRKGKERRKLDITHGFPLDFLVGMGAREIQVVDFLRGL